MPLNHLKTQIWAIAETFCPCNIKLNKQKQKMTNFTKEELKEIEKVFDVQASLLSSSYVKIFNTLSKMKNNNADKEKTKIIIDKLLDEYISAFVTFRAISGKANLMQNKKEVEK
jgi:hypothetical protein